MKSKEIKKAYEAVAKTYDKKALADGWKAHRKLAKLVLKFYKNKNAKVLDLGCGTGLSSIEFFKKKFNVAGIDVSPGMLNGAKKYPYEKLICQDLEKPLKVEDNAFDIIVLSGVMEFIEKPRDLFVEIKSKLRQEGFFALSVPKKYPKDSYLRDKLKRKIYSKKEIEGIFNNAGFKILKRKRIFGYHKLVEGKYEKSYYYLYVLKSKL